MSIVRRDLDAVASGLGVSNDADAIAVLTRLMAHAAELETGLLRLHNSVPDHGRHITTVDEFAVKINKASSIVREAWNQLCDLKISFTMHERGES